MILNKEKTLGAKRLSSALKTGGECGVCLFEFSIVLAALTFAGLIVVDMLSALDSYSRVTHAVREGAIVGSRWSNLSEGVQTNVDKNIEIVAACILSDGTEQFCAELELHRRIRLLLERTIDKQQADSASIISEVYLPVGANTRGFKVSIDVPTPGILLPMLKVYSSTETVELWGI